MLCMIAAGCGREESHPIPNSVLQATLGKNTGILFSKAACAFTASSPALYGDKDYCPGHEQGYQTHCDGECEHGIKFVGLQSSNGILVADHECDTSCDETERCDDFCGRSRWQVRHWRPDVESNVRERSAECKAHEHSTPLRMHHRREHRVLMVRTHHLAKQQDDEARHRIHREAVLARLLP